MNTAETVSNERLAEMGVDAIARLARMKGPLADVSAISAWMHDARNALRNAQSEAVAVTREQMDEWLTNNCGQGLPHGEASDQASMLHGLAYVLRQIEGSGTYKVNIGQCTSATSSLRMALDHFARSALTHPAPPLAVTDEMVERALAVWFHPMRTPAGDGYSEGMRAALTAALEAKQ